MELGQGGTESVRAAVGVAVQLGGAALDRLERCREGAERAFVGGELDDSREAELALYLLDGLTRLVGNEIVDRRPEEALGNFGKALSARLLFIQLSHKRKSTPRRITTRGQWRLETDSPPFRQPF